MKDNKKINFLQNYRAIYFNQADLTQSILGYRRFKIQVKDSVIFHKRS